MKMEMYRMSQFKKTNILLLSRLAIEDAASSPRFQYYKTFYIHKLPMKLECMSLAGPSSLV
jgi:hypothetical protein